MSDLRWKQLADILVNYSTKVRKNEKVFITMMEPESLPLVEQVYSKVVQAGGLPQVEYVSAILEKELMRHGTIDQINWIPEIQAYGMEWADVYIGLRGFRNPFEFSGISAERIAAHKKALGITSAMRTEQTRWVLIRLPNEAFAQQSQTSLDDMMQFFFNATIKDWTKETKRYKEIANVFQQGNNVRIIGKDTDIKFSTEGRIYEVGDGQFNMPDGEIFTSPVDDSANGYITFEFPGIYGSKLIEGIYLEFINGKVVKASAKSNQDLLLNILNTDEGSKQLGEFGVGTNFGIDRFSYDILFDEKIGGTIHLALGRAYAKCNGVNKSALHWDIIKDLREEGAVFLDGVKVIENGKFLI